MVNPGPVTRFAFDGNRIVERFASNQLCDFCDGINSARAARVLRKAAAGKCNIDDVDDSYVWLCPAHQREWGLRW